MKRRFLAGMVLVLVGFLASLGRAEPVAIRLVYMGDFHGRAEPSRDPTSQEQTGGISYAAARIEVLRNERPSLLLAAGDMLQGDAWANLSQGRSVIELMNAMEFDALVLGNHELDFGQEVLAKRISEARFAFLAANVEGLDCVDPYVILSRRGIRVAVLGLMTDRTPEATHPRNVTGLRFLHPAAVASRYVPELRRKADVVVILSHLGYHADRALAEQVPGIDVIVGGHSHTRLDAPEVVGTTVIVHSWEHGKVIGVLDLTVEGGNMTGFEGRLEEVRPASGVESPRIRAIVETYRREVETALAGTVARTVVGLNAADARVRETNFGNLVADAVREGSRADVAIINGGSIRSSIGRGDVSVRAIHTALPFENRVVVIRLTGRQLRDALEHGVSAVEDGAGRFPQVSGVAFTYSRTAPPGARVREIAVQGESVVSERAYRVATNDFLAAGGDGYSIFPEAGGKREGGYDASGPRLIELVIEHLRRAGTVTPSVEGRIRVVEESDGR